MAERLLTVPLSSAAEDEIMDLTTCSIRSPVSTSAGSPTLRLPLSLSLPSRTPLPELIWTLKPQSPAVEFSRDRRESPVARAIIELRLALETYSGQPERTHAIEAAAASSEPAFLLFASHSPCALDRSPVPSPYVIRGLVDDTFFYRFPTCILSSAPPPPPSTRGSRSLLLLGHRTRYTRLAKYEIRPAARARIRSGMESPYVLTDVG